MLGNWSVGGADICDMLPDSADGILYLLWDDSDRRKESHYKCTREHLW